MIIRFCSVCAVPLPLPTTCADSFLSFWIEMSFLTWQLVSIWIIFSVGRWYYLFFLLHASLGIVGTRSQNSTPSNMVFYQERVTVCRRLPIDNELWLEYHMSHSQSLACHTLGWPIQANQTTNPSKPNDQSKPTLTTRSQNSTPSNIKREGLRYLCM